MRIGDSMTSKNEQTQFEKYATIAVIAILLGTAVGFAFGYHLGAFDGYHLALRELHIVPPLIQL